MDLRIAFGGNMGSGKDTAVNYLIKTHGGVKSSFAKPLYDILEYAQERCGFSKEKDRKFLQFIGTEWGRSHDKDVWIRIAIQELPRYGNVFISDVRFPNEFQALKKLGWTCVKIIREKPKGREGNGDASHSSETSMEDITWDYVIENTGTVQDLHAQLDNLVKSM